MSTIARPLSDRFWEMVNKDGPIPPHRPELGPCWVWTGSLRGGYGTISLGGRGGLPARSNRVAWYLHHGIWPEPCALHACDNKLCVRIDHLFEGTFSDNLRDLVDKGLHHHTKKTHCLRGHEYSPENTRVQYKNGRPSRSCRACNIERHRHAAQENQP